MTIALKNYFVAFIDILGFKDMVKHDCEHPEENQKYIETLYNIHLETRKLKETNQDIHVYQFSDSIVISQPFAKENFDGFCDIVSKYQYKLFLSGILCRGGISYGKHFASDTFIFSAGMIDAYFIETSQAITPRIVVSKDLMELVHQDINRIDNKILLRENDSLFFINYFESNCAIKTWKAIENIIPEIFNSNASIRHKQIWIKEYYNFCFPSLQKPSISKFS